MSPSLARIRELADDLDEAGEADLAASVRRAAESVEAAPAQDGALDEVLQALRDGCRTQVLRRFAAEAATSVLTDAPESAQRLVEAARRRADGVSVDLQAVREPLSGTATAAGTIGMGRRATNAPAFLAAYSSCAPDAYQAAHQTAQMVRRHGQFSGRDPAGVESALLHLLS